MAATLKCVFALALLGTVQVAHAHSSSARRATQRVCAVPNDALVYIDGCDPNAMTIDLIGGSTVLDLGQQLVTCDDGSEACEEAALLSVLRLPFKLLPILGQRCKLIVWYSM